MYDEIKYKAMNGYYSEEVDFQIRKPPEYLKNPGLPMTEAPHLLPEPLAAIVRLVAGTRLHPGQPEMNKATVETTLASIRRFLEEAE